MFFFYFYPTPITLLASRAAVVSDEKTFNWGEKRENWKNYNDKRTSSEKDPKTGLGGSGGPLPLNAR